MKVRVLFFAQLREAFGTGEKVVEIEGSASIDRMMTTLLGDSKLTPLRSLPIRYAVNETFVSGDELLQDQDRLALIPPVAGG